MLIVGEKLDSEKAEYKDKIREFKHWQLKGSQETFHLQNVAYLPPSYNNFTSYKRHGHYRQYPAKKYIPNSLTNKIYGKNDQLSVRLDTHISAGRGGYKEARNDTRKGLSSWADHYPRRSRKND